MSRADLIAWDIAGIILFVVAGGVIGWLVRDYWREAVMRWETRHDGGGYTVWTDDGPITADHRSPRQPDHD